ncbi:MAG: phosphatidylserine decarboxylase [Bdellovibrionales bacterium]|nr:phosphatidylserine decarboxylase [Bdellovibrionales bacterium]
MSIRFYNRATKKIEEEKVFGGSAVDWAYKDAIGLKLTDAFFSKPWLSKLMGAYEDSWISRGQIGKFIDQYQIDMKLFEDARYSNFNQFFIRRFRDGIRPFVADPRAFCAGAEARYLAFNSITSAQTFHVKGIEINLGELLHNAELGALFDGGTLIIARLCPVDYHRFHFPTDGAIQHFERVAGDLHSVNPVALTVRPDVFLRNERHVTVYEHDLFGKVAMIEVGALGVGKIVQSGPKDSNRFVKGREKGYFLFGGSTVIWVLQKSRLVLSADLSQNSRQGLETWIPLGDKLGECKSGLG